MLSLTAPQIAAINANSIVRRDAILLELDSGNYGFWAGVGPVNWNGITFQGSGQLIEIEQDGQGIGMESAGLTLRLYANSDIGLTPNVLATIFEEKTRGRRFTGYEMIFDVESRAMIGVPIVRYRGYVHAVEMKTEGDSTFIEGKVESRSIDFTRRGWAMANSAHHAQVSPGDTFFDASAVAGRVSLYFGGPVPVTAANSRPVA